MLRKWMLIVAAAFSLAACNLPAPETTPTPTAGFNVPVSVTEIPATPTLPPPPVLQNDRCGNPYYPIVDGATWTYTITTDGSVTTATHTMDVVDDGSFTLTVRDGDSVFTLDGTCGDDGVILLDVPGVSATYSDSEGGSTLSTTNDDGVTVPDDVQVGDDWSQTTSVVGSSGGEVTLSATITTSYKALGYEIVTVPAGTFNALKVEQTGSLTIQGSPAFDTHGFIWYAQGVGVVKSGLEGTYMAELVSYNIP